ncbi:DUF2239 family protein [Variovorax sp. Sphag1AA]|uniref:DUF2239 family protein n=1 Tax=Variovorax sp. Sphag1AA TaxID=2587027 RepID=UPI00160A8B9C|nr:DUF2239 family protein [Variovorax sp. Sphag1AA]MBB3176405.1 hypothetical protein [Variovorax sp. Sphag1AA]
MSSSPESNLTAFAGFQRIASGPRAKVIAQVRKQCARSGQAQPFVFDDSTGERLDIDLREDAPAPAAAPDEPSTRGVGRPKLGVVAREVTLLPRHWEWLARQPGGASVALRRLIDEARHVHADRDAQRAAREATYRFMTVMAGDLSGFEEAARALFAGDRARFDEHISTWPEDVQAHLHKLATAAWSAAA